MRAGKPESRAERARCLFELYEQRMYRVAHAILHDEGLAEDAVMDAFEKVLRRPLDADPRSEASKRLVLSAVKSASIDLYRKRSRERTAVTYPGDQALASVAGEGAAEASSEHEALLEGLPSHYRKVLHNRFVEERSVAETAENLGITQVNVRKRQQRAIEALRRKRGASNG